MAAERSVPITVNCKPALADELRALAETEHRSLSAQVKHLIALGLEVGYETAAAE
jgi:hypothetical protein